MVKINDSLYSLKELAIIASCEDKSDWRAVKISKFMSLSKTYYKTNWDVDFYADQLFISPRHLSFVRTKNVTHLSAKKIIDLGTILEIKILLKTLKYSIKKIAEIMHFPDQSYLGRFFKEIQVNPLWLIVLERVSK